MLGSLIRRLRTDQQGWSLVELLVVMTLFSGLMGICFSVLISVQNQTADGLARDEAVVQANLGLAQIDRQVRSGNVVITPGTVGELANSLRVYTQTYGVRKCVQWQVYQGTLRYRSWDPLGDGTVVNSWSVVARNLVDDPSAAPRPSFQPVQQLAGSQAQSVRVNLWIKPLQDKGKPVEISTVLFGRNTVYGFPGDVCSNVPPA